MPAFLYPTAAESWEQNGFVLVAKPLILLTNDDGIYAQGILAAWQELRKIGDVEVVAPDAERSAVGHAITLLLPLRAKEVVRRNARFGYAVNGMPADCVKIAVRAILPRPPDLVVSGINLGANTGTNVIYSGTVSAATEARILGIPSIAVSLSTFTHPNFSYAAKFTRKLAVAVLAKGLPDKTLLNVNIPNLPEDQIKGVAITQQGESRVEERFEKRTDPRNQTYYWLDGQFRLQEPKNDADAAMVSDGYVSITPVQYDLTAYAAIAMLKDWNLQP
jgi:5'-nucleotidase